MVASVTINNASVFASSRGAATAGVAGAATAVAVARKVNAGAAVSLLAMVMVVLCAPAAAALNVTVNVAELPFGTVPVPPEIAKAGLLLAMPVTTRSPAAFGMAPSAPGIPPPICAAMDGGAFVGCEP